MPPDTRNDRPQGQPSGDSGKGPVEHVRPVTGPRAASADTVCPLLGPDDPPPFRIINGEDERAPLLVCDHASRAIPKSLDNLGLGAEQLDRHIAYDIGAAAVTERLAQHFGFTAVLSGYSRLVIDPNRALDDPTAIPVVSDDVIIPGNRAIDRHETARRVNAIFKPYQDAIAAEIARRRAKGLVPVILSMHSFTPVMRGFVRPWHIGILWDRDDRVAAPLIAALRKDGRWNVGDNEPYSGQNTPGGTIETHATPAGLPNILVEFRQDLVGDADGVALWADEMIRALEPILGREELQRIEYHLRE